MKQFLWRWLCLGVLAAVLAGSALAATPGYTVDQDGTVNYYDYWYNRYFTAECTEGIIDGESYAILFVAAELDPETHQVKSYTVNEDTIMYIGQVHTWNGKFYVEGIKPRSMPDSVVLLGGKFSDGQSPKVLGTVIGHGVTIRGSVTSQHPGKPVTVELYQEGSTSAPAASTQIPAAAGSGQATQEFELTGVPAGRYDLKITKEGHTVCWVTGIQADIDIVLETPIVLPAGDVDGDGTVNILDANETLRSDTYNKAIDEAQVKLADTDGDGSVNILDVNVILSSDNYNMGTIIIEHQQ